jgi:hypothetical protein
MSPQIAFLLSGYLVVYENKSKHVHVQYYSPKGWNHWLNKKFEENMKNNTIEKGKVTTVQLAKITI